MQISEVMTANPQSVSSTDTLRDVAAKMETGNFGSAPVVDGGKLVGVVTDRDIAIRGVAQGMAPDHPVSHVMTADPVCVAADSSVAAAAKLMQEKQIRRLYITDGDQLAGVVSLGDVALQGSETLSGETLEQISKS